MTRQEVMERLCLLMSRANNLAGWEHPADCICGENSQRLAEWDRLIPIQIQTGLNVGSDYQNDGAALEIIEALINDALRRKGVTGADRSPRREPRAPLQKENLMPKDSTETSPQSVAIASLERGSPVARTSSAFTLQPANLSEAMEFARLIAVSELCPTEYRGKPQSVLIAVMMGAELGISPMQSLQNIAVINGRPTMWGDLVLALVQASGLLESIEERDAQEALAVQEGHCEVKRRGASASVIRTFSMAMADKAGLTKRGGPSAPWSTYPGRMLQMRARSWALRDGFADVLKGLQIREEVADYPPDAPPIQMPRRASEVSSAEVDRFVQAPTAAGQRPPAPAAPPASAPRTLWTGKIHSVTEKHGETKGKKWTLYTVTGTDGTEFGTFDGKDAEFARGTGSSEVDIVWEETSRGTKKIIAIQPAAREPGDEAPGA